MTRTIAIIAAVAENGGVGFKGGIPWDSPEDRRIFARKTAGGVLLCGRNTATTMIDSIANNPSGRLIVCIERGQFMEWSPDFDAWGPSWIEMGPYSLEAVAAHYPDRNIWICGGSRLYAEAMRHPLVTEMHISHMDGYPEADTFFPRYAIGPGVLQIRAGGYTWSTVETTEYDGFTHKVYRRI